MAYGARLESVLGESPRGFESPILRQIDRRSPDAHCIAGAAFPLRPSHVTTSGGSEFAHVLINAEWWPAPPRRMM